MIATLSSLVGITAACLSGFVFMDDRHAHQEDVQVAAQQAGQMMLDVRIDVLQQQIDMLEDKSTLNAKEQQRLQDMKSELKSIKDIKLKYQTQ